ncbi:MAG: NFACT RNA binding domain-containing protein [Proteobacteria bacterium]|nr:NFACT RNA binding domain-containing protein [Pseudomonadota bacterium]
MDNPPQEDSYRLSIAKCWQGKEPWLCFQATITTLKSKEVIRSRGYLIIDARRGKETLSWTHEKPEGLLSSGGGAADVIRKFVSSAGVGSLILGTEKDPGKFLGLGLITKNASLNASTKRLEVAVKATDRFLLLVHAAHPPELEFLGIASSSGVSGEGLVSYLRWSERGLFTVRKSPEDLASESHSWLLRSDESPHSAMIPIERKSPTLEYILKGWINYQESSTPESISPEPSPKSPLKKADPMQTTLPLHQREARDRVARRLRTIQKTLGQDAQKIPLPQSVSTLKQHGKLLQSWLHLIKPDDYELVLTAEQANADCPVVIPLDTDLSPGENLNQIYRQIQRLQKALDLGTKRLELVKRSEASLQKILGELRGEAHLTIERTLQLMNEAGLASSSGSRSSSISISRSKPNPLHAKPTLGAGATESLKSRINPRQMNLDKLKGRVFLSSEGAVMQLGRSAEENDRITKAAKSNDWWFHAAGWIHGTHVIVHKRSVQGANLLQATVREASILALHFSSQALSRAGEVYQTTRGLLKKRRGMPPGLWTVERTASTFVRYEESELKAIFSRESRRGTLRQQL